MEESNHRKIHFSWVLAVLALGFALRIIYVFYFSDYSKNIFSDMEVYWNHAHHHYEQKPSHFSLWHIWPPFFHIFLSYLFSIIHFFGLDNYRLETILALNTILSTASIYWVYEIASQVLKSPHRGLWAAGIYGFTPGLIHHNAFILSEVPGFFFLLLSFKFLLSKQHLFWAGAALGIATLFRPMFGILGLSGILWAWLLRKNIKDFIFRSVAYSIPFWIAVGGMSLRNHIVSEGKLSFLGANGHINLAFMGCKIRSMKSSFGNKNWFVKPPSRMSDFKIRDLTTSKPFYDRDFFIDTALSFVSELSKR